MNGEVLTGNVALLIDADNASAATIDPVLTRLADIGEVNIRRIYGNWSKQTLNGWRDVALRYALDPQQQFDLTKGKNATDMKMTIDAMDLLASGRVTGFGIMSSDSDFMPLVTRIRQDGLTVYGFGRATTPEGFRQACNRFIDVDTFQRSATLPNVVPEVAAATAAASPIKPEVVQMLIDVYEATKRDAQGFASLSAVGQRAANRSSFDKRNYGFKQLGDLFEAIPDFEVDRRDNGAFVRRKR